MKTTTLCLFAIAALVALVSPVLAQDQPSSNFTAIYHITVKDGSETEFEAGLGKHVNFHKKQKDPNGYAVNVVEMGYGMGEYHIVLGNRTLASFDEDSDFQEADEADGAKTFQPYIESMTSRLAIMADSLSYPPETPTTGGVSWVTYDYIKDGSVGDYALFRRKLKEASEKAGDDRHYVVLQIINGAEGPAFIEVRPSANWAGFAPGGVRGLLTDAFGETEAQRLLDLAADATRGSRSFIVRSRSELGYQPE